MTDNIIDLTEKRAQKQKQIISADKTYKISGSLVIMLCKFARFIASKDSIKTEEEKMQTIGWLCTLTDNILKEKFEEVDAQT